ncbi:MAG: class II aldolase/adducin family protein [Cyclobacteriaceae bacterium]|nr:class II aldolase/adducin family protein [Cyclobacteriaceae bacterium]
MKKEISNLVEISRYYGAQKDFTLGGGGNTSYKDRNFLYVKASGFSLATITEEGFAVLNRKDLAGIMTREYSRDSHQREHEVMSDLMNSLAEGSKKLRPSVEASLHDIIQYSYVVHMHPHLINALLCSNDVEMYIEDLFDDKVIYIPYTEPGYVLSKTVSEYIDKYRSRNGSDPNIIFLQNHGVFVGGDSTREIRQHYAYIMEKILSRIDSIIKIEPIDYQGPIDQVIKILSGLIHDRPHFKHEFNTLIAHFTRDIDSLSRVDKPFIPDEIVYCKAHPAIIPLAEGFSIVPESIEESIVSYQDKHGYDPKVILIEKGPVIALDKNEKSAELVLDVFQDAMKISFYSNFFGGPHFMTEEQIRFIENWEVEHYRRKISAGSS